MIRYVITTHEDASGAFLSRPGHWGNLSHTSTAAAKAAAERDAKGAPFTIETVAHRRRRNPNARI